ncbi:sulfotransferase [Spongiibacter marinus]|uniref:sulfotransferase n=1 Tax=Spongiibacter marinus TaxID=354246 RepID=UPI003564BE68
MIPDSNMNPVIIVGPHRSGTSMLSRIVERHGVFLGARKDENNESKFFIKINEMLLREAGATWDNPESSLDYYQCKDVIERLSGAVKRQLEGLGSVEYWGKLLPVRNSVRWGWKDPRNTFTLPVWLELFPNAKVVLANRNILDVASSLNVRAKAAEPRLGLVSSLVGNSYVSMGQRCLSFDRAMEVAVEYARQAVCLKKICGDQLYEIKYETLCRAENISGLFEFLELPCGPEVVDHVAAFFDSDKVYRFKDALPECDVEVAMNKFNLDKDGYYAG